ncbi:MAG TPA: hypothetical protein VM487_14185 [Phycisphaerae bacterium]|nr:hypothetical protein [Phycisphaerae bacterium]
MTYETQGEFAARWHITESTVRRLRRHGLAGVMHMGPVAGAVRIDRDIADHWMRTERGSRPVVPAPGPPTRRWSGQDPRVCGLIDLRPKGA